MNKKQLRKHSAKKISEIENDKELFSKVKKYDNEKVNKILDAQKLEFDLENYKDVNMTRKQYKDLQNAFDNYRKSRKIPKDVLTKARLAKNIKNALFNYSEDSFETI